MRVGKEGSGQGRLPGGGRHRHQWFEILHRQEGSLNRSRLYKRHQRAKSACTWVDLHFLTSGSAMTGEKEHRPLNPRQIFPLAYGLCGLGQGLNHSKPQFPPLKNEHSDIYLTRLVCRASETMQLDKASCPCPHPWHQDRWALPPLKAVIPLGASEPWDALKDQDTSPLAPR